MALIDDAYGVGEGLVTRIHFQGTEELETDTVDWITNAGKISHRHYTR